MNNNHLSCLLFQILPSIMFYRTVNINLQKWRNNSPTENIRIISSIHAIISSILSYAYLTKKISISLFSPAVGLVSYGYFLIDLSHILLYKKQYSQPLFYSYLFHHIFAFIGLSYIDIYPYYLARAYLAEISTPFLNLSWYLNKRHQKGILYFTNASLVVVLFFVFRILNLSQMLIKGPKDGPLIFPFLCFSFWLMNVLWMRGLTKIYWAEFKKKIIHN